MRAWFRNDLGTITYSPREWAVVRVGFALLVWHATFFTWNPLAVDIPDGVPREGANGLAGVVPLDWLGQPGATWVVMALTAALLVGYMSGRWLPLMTGGLFLIHAAVGAIFSSPAKHHHATQVVGLVLLGQFGFFLWETWRRRRREGEASEALPGLRGGSGAIFLSQQMMCAGYVVSAISKWVNSGGGLVPGWRWLQQLPNIAVQFEKNHMQAYYDTLEAPSGAFNRVVIDFISEHPQWAKVMFAPGFYVELFAFVALFNRRLAAITGLALIALHSLISEIMHLNFIYFKVLLLLYFVHLPYWWRALGERLRGGRRDTSSSEVIGPTSPV